MSTAKHLDSSSQRLELLVALCTRLNEEVALKPLLEASLALIVDRMRFDAAWIYLFDENHRYYLAASAKLPQAFRARDQAGFAWGPCRCQSMLGTGLLDQPVSMACDRIERVRETIPAAGPGAVDTQTGGLRDHISIPLRVAGRDLGIMNLARRGGTPLDAEDLSILTFAGHMASAAIHRARPHELLVTDQLRELQALRDLSETLVGAVDPKAIAQATASIIFDNLRVHGVSLEVPAPEGTHLDMVANVGWAAVGGDRPRTPLQPPESSGAAWSFHTRAVVRGHASDPHLPFRVPAERARAVKACLHVPMRSGERTLGIITADRLTEDLFTSAEERFISLSANMAAVALERASLFDTMRAVVQASPVAIIATDLDDRITEWNPAAESMFGWARADVLGREPPTVPPDGVEERRVHLRRLFRGEVLEQLEVRRLRKDRSPIEASVWAAPMRDAGRNVIGAIGFLVDMTEHKRAGETIRRHTERLGMLSRRLLEVQEEERRSIARELHDEVGQMLTALNLLLATATGSLDVRKIQEAQGIVTEVIGRLRDLSLDLRPALLDDLGLLPALLWHLERFSARTGVRVEFKHEGLEGRRFRGNLETAVYRIAQEALTNVARHARVKDAVVQLQAGQETIVLQVKDLGVGFNPEGTLAAGSTGVLGMRERAGLLGAQLMLESAPGMGTTVTAVVPIEESAHDVLGQLK